MYHAKARYACGPCQPVACPLTEKCRSATSRFEFGPGLAAASGKLSSLRASDTDAVPAFRVSAPRSTAEIARHSS
jgi:hypothetical protein